MHAIDFPTNICIIGRSGSAIANISQSRRDEELLESLKKEHELVLTLEDGILDGGFGEKIARFYGTDSMKVKNYGLSNLNLLHSASFAHQYG